MGQGFFGYNPPQFVLNAAKQALDKVDCNQYSPTKVVSFPILQRPLLISDREDRG
jgi:hypothetical protein